jgi:catechol 2,3-dioxygenase-like lactoylglutathione lyase family enzyme
VSVVVPRFAQVVIDSVDARRSAEFWRQLLGLVYRAGHEPPPPVVDDRAGREWLNLYRPDGTRLLAIEQVDQLTPTTWPDPTVPQQLHLDLVVDNVDDLDACHERVIALGGTLRDDRREDPQEPLRVYADPDGHTFCIFVLAPGGGAP